MGEAIYLYVRAADGGRGFAAARHDLGTAGTAKESTDKPMELTISMMQ